MTSPIFVTRPKLPPLAELNLYLNQIWQRGILTNNGPVHAELEHALCEYLGVPYISLYNNGTTALLAAMEAFDLQGEVITSPFSFVATSHSILWSGLKPVFVDIDEKTCNLNPEKSEKAITPQTSAIMPVHTYGAPCDVERIKKIADKYGLKVIYDAAHAFGIQYGNQSLLNFGDLSVLSFHATKVFSTVEGGRWCVPILK